MSDTFEEIYGDTPDSSEGAPSIVDTVEGVVSPDAIESDEYSKLFETPAEPEGDEVEDPFLPGDKKTKEAKSKLDLDGIVEDFKKLGAVDDDILKEFLPEGTALTQDLLAKAIKEQPNRIANKILHEANDRSEGLVAFMSEGGNVQEWINTYMDSRTLIEQHDIQESDDSAIAVNRAVFRSMGMSDEAINNKLNRLQSLGSLKEEALENYEVYTNLKSNAIANLNARQSKQAQQEQESAEQVQQTIRTYISEFKDINGIVFDKKAKSKLEEDIFTNGRLSKRLNGPEASKLYVKIAALEQLGLLDDDYSKFSIIPTKGASTPTKSDVYDFTKRLIKR